MANEVLVKQERNAWAVVLRALIEASTNGNKHVIGSGHANEFIPHDLNRLMTHIKRINTDYVGGTPDGLTAKGLTDLFMSPEMMQHVRAFAYHAVNAQQTGTTNAANIASGPITLPDNVREDIWNSGGMSSLYGVVLHELLELGSARKYNKLFGTLLAAGSEVIPNGGGAGTFSTAGTADELMVGVDLSRESLVRPVAREHDSGGTFSVLPDDQFVARAEKMGFYGFLEEGRVCLDARALVGLVI
jgi:hypothetical protein